MIEKGSKQNSFECFYFNKIFICTVGEQSFFIGMFNSNLLLYKILFKF